MSHATLRVVGKAQGLEEETEKENVTANTKFKRKSRANKNGLKKFFFNCLSL